MALSFNNCLIPQGSGTNEMYGDCCCEITCDVTVTEPIVMEDFDSFFLNESFFLQSTPRIAFNGSNVQYPYPFSPGDVFQVTFDICAAAVGNVDTLELGFSFIGMPTEKFYFNFTAINLYSSIAPNSFAFGNTVVDTTKTLEFQFRNMAMCCYTYEATTDCPEITITPSTSDLLCAGDKQTGIKVDWAPTSLGNINCSLIVSIGCQTMNFPITGRGINPPSGSATPAAQKNKVDQTTRVEACSPRSANNRCQTARTMQAAIRTNARRFGKR
jgi:hypothetical protein